MRASLMRVIVWFKGTNDLRVHDNPLLARAAELCAQHPGAVDVIPVYCFDPYFWGESEYGTRKMAPHRGRFLVESVADLRAQLRAQVGSDLLTGMGPPEDLIRSLASSAAPGASVVVLASQEVTSEELALVARARSALSNLPERQCRLESLWMSSLYHLDDLPYRPLDPKLPDVFSVFRERVERDVAPRAMARTPKAGELPLPRDKAACCAAAGAAAGSPAGAAAGLRPSFDSLPSPPELGAAPPLDDPRAVMRFTGGETAALARVAHYLFGADCLKAYFETRNGLVGADYSSKLAPWLAHGCLSPLLVLREVRRYEAERVANKSTYWLLFELLVRDHFRLLALRHGDKIFKPGGVVGEAPRWVQGAEAERRFRAWKEGRTGLPLVDACMRELAASGFMSNRGRQNVASYLAHDLQLDWRLGADHFESLLVDYDPASNWGNWVSVAGLARRGRVNQFNIVKQSRDYDADGAYVRLWCPELQRVPTQWVHTPWEMPPDVQARVGVRVGEGMDYPAPLVVPPGHAFARQSGASSARGPGPGGGRPGSGRPTGGAPRSGGRAPPTRMSDDGVAQGGEAPGTGDAQPLRRLPQGGRVQH